MTKGMTDYTSGHWEWRHSDNALGNKECLMSIQGDARKYVLESTGEMRINNYNKMTPMALSRDCPNARLIAAAPDLLEAAKLAINALGNHIQFDDDEIDKEQKAHDALAFAINKALGKKGGPTDPRTGKDPVLSPIPGGQA